MINTVVVQGVYRHPVYPVKSKRHKPGHQDKTYRST